MTHTRMVGAILFAFVLAVSVVAPAAGAGLTGSQLSDQDVTFTDSPAEIADEVENAEGTIEVFVRLEDPPSAQIEGNGPRALKEQAQSTQGNVLTFAGNNDGISVINTFWITNAVLVEVDTSAVDLTQLASIQHVDQLHSNFEVELPAQPAPKKTPAASLEASNYETTYGLEQINAPRVWDEFGTQGEGAKVAVLDTGVDADHPDIDLYTEDPDDPTYPGGWAEIGDDGEPVDGSEPFDSDEHGTHTSGTVSGGDASGEYIGVAPDVKLLHGLVLDGGSGSAATIIGGMEWAVQEDADVISMSLGSSDYTAAFIEPVQNAHDAGSIVIAATGNDGEGNTGAPGNIYDSLGIGATDSNGDVTDFSGGEVIDTSEAWGSDAPSYWPDQYTLPDVVAPGKAVKSAVPGGEYKEFPGTSMATPHVAGVAALMVSAGGGDLPVDTVKQTLIDTAVKPDGAPEQKDNRYGEGIVDAYEAVKAVALDSGVEGTVTSDGEPVEGATVELGGSTTTTDANGQFELPAEPGSYELTVSGTGIQETTESVTVEQDQYTQVDVSAPPALGVSLAFGQSDAVESGDTVQVTLNAQNLETLTVELSGTYDAGDAALTIDGQSADFGQTVDLGEFDGELTLTVETTANTAGTLELTHTATGAGQEATLTTGPTEVVEQLRRVGLVGSSYTGDVQSTLQSKLPVTFEFGSLGSAADADSYDVVVVQTLAGVDAQAFVEATESSDIGVLYLDQWGDEANAIPDLAGVSDVVSGTAEDDSYSGNVEGPISYEATADHPILDGIAAPGETTLIHEGQYADVAYFESTSYDVIGAVADTDGAVGSALAVDDASNTVLAASLGYTQYVGSDQYTDTADAILANAVEYLASGGDDQTGDVSVGLSPDQTTVDSSKTTTFELVVENASEGIGAYNLTVEVGNSSVANITDATLTNDPEFPHVENNGKRATLEVGMGENVHDAGAVVVAEITVKGLEQGETSLSMSNVEVLDTSNLEYGVGEVSGAGLTVEERDELPPVVADRPPRDLDDDGLYEDVNGDDELDIFDVQTLFSNLESDAVRNNPEAYNFNGDENPQEVTIFDVQALFSLVQAQVQAAMR